MCEQYLKEIGLFYMFYVSFVSLNSAQEQWEHKQKIWSDIYGNT